MVKRPSPLPQTAEARRVARKEKRKRRASALPFRQSCVEWRHHRQSAPRRNPIAILTLTAARRRLTASAARRLLLKFRRGEKPARLSRSGTTRRKLRLATEQVATMKHASTRAVCSITGMTGAATARRPNAPISIHAAIRHALGDTFMLAADFVDTLRFRLAGTRVSALFCREIKGEEFQSLWNEASAGAIKDLINVVNAEKIGAVAGVTGRTEDGAEIDLEFLLLPLAHSGHARISRARRAGAGGSAFCGSAKSQSSPSNSAHCAISAPASKTRSPRNSPTRPRRSRCAMVFVVYSGGARAPVRQEHGLTYR